MKQTPQTNVADGADLERRHLVQALAGGLAATGLASAPAQAQGASANSSNPAYAADATDYQRDPSNWGSPEVAALFPGFIHMNIKTSGAVIRLRHGGSGPPLLLLHGNPENHVAWHKIAARLARDYHVILPDLRGYGDSSLPEPGPNHINYSFRAMAHDMVEVMEQLGYGKFSLAGHDRGGRTAHRLCMDHPDRVIKVGLLDVLPNYFVWTHPTKAWVIGTWHWGFMAQPEPFPERMISAVGAEYFLKSRMAIRGGTGLDFLTPTSFAEYVRCYTLKTITGSCRDYRATATCDFEMDTADKDRPLKMPALVLWGARGQSPARSREFLDVWKQFATDVVVAEGMNCGHYMAEEIPDLLYDKFRKFFVA
jgi:haloacetate dehalogenase